MNTSSSANQSTVSLIQHVRAKDFSSALSSLLSVYGTNGSTPSRPSSPQRKRKLSKDTSPNVTPSSADSTSPPAERDWLSTFAQLQSQYGANGLAPMRPTTKASSKSKKSKTERKESHSPTDISEVDLDRLDLSAYAPINHSGYIGSRSVAFPGMPRGRQ